MKTNPSFIRKVFGILFALSLLHQVWAQDSTTPRTCNLLDPSFYLSNPDRLLHVWCSQPIQIASYTHEELNLQQSLNRKEDLIVTTDPGSLTAYENPPVYSEIDQTPITPYTWKWVHLDITTQTTKGPAKIKAKLRRPNWWLEKHHLQTVADSAIVNLNTLGIDGFCVVTGIYPNTFDSRIENDDGLRPVIGFFEQEKQTVYSFSFSGGKDIEATPGHPVWSCDRETWVPLSELLPGEQVKTNAGADLRYLSSAKRDATSVYNIEVYRDHTYYVGDPGLLAHNTCLGVLLKGLSKAAREAEEKALKKAGIWSKLLDANNNSLPLHEAIKELSTDATRQLIDDLKKTPALLARLDANPRLVKAWEVLSINDVMRKNPADLEKLFKYMDETGADKARLIESFKNTPDARKWVDMKIPEAELNKIYNGFKDDPPFDLDAWTPQHKAQRWDQYKARMKEEGNAEPFETWSNRYDGNIEKANAAKKATDDYFNSLNLDCPPTRCREVNINVNGKTRRLDIADRSTGKAVEFKRYSEGKVYKSKDIENEVNLDKAILEQGIMTEIEWVFKGCEPSGPLRELLEGSPNPIKVIIIP